LKWATDNVVRQRWLGKLNLYKNSLIPVNQGFPDLMQFLFRFKIEMSALLLLVRTAGINAAARIVVILFEASKAF
jgi:hypothetical protein